MGRLEFPRRVTQVLGRSFIPKHQVQKLCVSLYNLGQVQGMPAIPLLVIVLMNFLESEDKGLHYYSPWSGPEVACGRGKHVQP